jgi:hypothetical protein
VTGFPFLCGVVAAAVAYGSDPDNIKERSAPELYNDDDDCAAVDAADA